MRLFDQRGSGIAGAISCEVLIPIPRLGKTHVIDNEPLSSRRWEKVQENKIALE